MLAACQITIGVPPQAADTPRPLATVSNAATASDAPDSDAWQLFTFCGP